MPKINSLTKILACAGCVFIWFPILTPIIFAFVSYFSDGIFRFDYLMPAELFPFALLGGCMLFWAAIRAQSHRRLLGWGMVGAIALLIGSQSIAVATGLASGDAEASGWRFILTMVIFILFLLFLLATAISGIALLRKLFQKAPEPNGDAYPTV